MTKEEAYNSMIQGLPVSHKDFGPGEFLWMDDNYIIKDENGDEFETSWDVHSGDRWEANWYIYKNAGKDIKNKMISNGNKKQARLIEDNLIPHKLGNKCPGNNKCLQYNLLGEYSCVVCDCKDEVRFINDSIPQQQLLENTLDLTENSTIENIETEHKKKGRLKTFLNKLFRKGGNN